MIANDDSSERPPDADLPPSRVGSGRAPLVYSRRMRHLTTAVLLAVATFLAADSGTAMVSHDIVGTWEILTLRTFGIHR